MATPYLGEIRLFGFNFAPKGWAFCQGQTMSIQQNAALFAIIGTYYGGNGVTTFALPDLQGRVPIHQGSNGSSIYTIGEMTGTENVTLLTNNLPIHNHSAGCYNGAGNSYTGTNAVPAKDAGGNNLYSSPSNNLMSSGALANSGGNQPHENRQPFLVMNYCIALSGIFPSRN